MEPKTKGGTVKEIDPIIAELKTQLKAEIKNWAQEVADAINKGEKFKGADVIDRSKVYNIGNGVIYLQSWKDLFILYADSILEEHRGKNLNQQKKIEEVKSKYQQTIN